MFQLAAGVFVFHILLVCVSILIAFVDGTCLWFHSLSLFCPLHFHLISFVIRYIFRSSLIRGGVRALLESRCTQWAWNILNHMIRSVGRSHLREDRKQ